MEKEKYRCSIMQKVIDNDIYGNDLAQHIPKNELIWVELGKDITIRNRQHAPYEYYQFIKNTLLDDLGFLNVKQLNKVDVEIVGELNYSKDGKQFTEIEAETTEHYNCKVINKLHRFLITTIEI